MNYTNYNGEWNWLHFKPKEIACRCCGELFVGNEMTDLFKDAMDKLEKLRVLRNKPIIINSGHRCVRHNKNIGGVKNSMHLKVAFDCRCPLEEQKEFCKQALEVGFSVARPYPNKGFVHIDTGRVRHW